jgi:hypothetical protein
MLGVVTPAFAFDPPQWSDITTQPDATSVVIRGEFTHTVTTVIPPQGKVHCEGVPWETFLAQHEQQAFVQIRFCSLKNVQICTNPEPSMNDSLCTTASVQAPKG